MWISILNLIACALLMNPDVLAAQEFWEEEIAEEFKIWYPQVQSQYESEHGNLSAQGEKDFKKELWAYLWKSRQQEINSLNFRDEELEIQPSSISLVQLSKAVKDRILSQGVSKKALERTLTQLSHSKVKKRDRLVIIDFSKKATERRFFYINLKSGTVEKHHVTHGKNSGPHSGVATKFSSQAGSNRTPAGFHVTSGRGRNKPAWGSAALILDGIEKFNANSRARGILAHGASYAAAGGRSNGCPALDIAVARRLFPVLTGGVLWYHYTGK